jgi:hypothetical protein
LFFALTCAQLGCLCELELTRKSLSLITANDFFLFRFKTINFPHEKNDYSEFTKLTSQ